MFDVAPECDGGDFRVLPEIRLSEEGIGNCKLHALRSMRLVEWL